MIAEGQSRWHPHEALVGSVFSVRVGVLARRVRPPFIQLLRSNHHEVSDQTGAVLIIRVVPDMLWFGRFIHAGPDGSAGFRMELSCVPVIAMVDTDGTAFTDTCQDLCLLHL